MTATLPEAAVATTSLREVAHGLPVPEGYRVEIIGGVIVVTPAPAGKHGRIVRQLGRALERDLPEGYDFEVNLGVDKAPGSDDYAIPDLFVAPVATLDTWASTVPSLEVVFTAEVVSKSSQTIDRVAKRKQYAVAGIPLYLLVDPFAEEITLFSDPSHGEYRARHTVPWGDKLQLPEPLPALLDSSLFPSLDGRPQP
ncbi:Uma2 family endonuclease [Streptomyces sp. DSM 42041]|uniref:Uma2 family endonuclease n=1 Tax=Streptomyces hazeniae TaxID=3075538 RepID=A0ABU2NLT8_9ACTN|nr:Uma2 family endonuclease [Streptomyces sp. DSM 42041]MDT0377936.1 Uma2 family endonuclease [Streptomyces sp. DSM 42041]